MVKHTQKIRRQQPINFLSVFDYFVGLAIKVLIKFVVTKTNFSTRSQQKNFLK